MAKKNDVDMIVLGDLVQSIIAGLLCGSIYIIQAILPSAQV
jgi:hypothetical protein